MGEADHLAESIMVDWAFEGRKSCLGGAGLLVEA